MFNKLLRGICQDNDSGTECIWTDRLLLYDALKSQLYTLSDGFGFLVRITISL